jgi:alpha-tubulin suppressor-like RCC1 family protein/invasion protein IalB
MKRRNLLSAAFAVVFLVFTCAKDPADLRADNPLDSEGSNWHPPTVVAMRDTSVNINDSITITAVGSDNGTIVKYIWAKNGLAFADTTTAGALKVAYPDSGRKYVLVKVVDNDSVVSVNADTCVVRVTLDPPVVNAMRDTTVNINDSITITATATDNGTVMKYLWAKNGSAYLDTTLLGSLKVAYPDSGRKVVRVKVIDDDGIFSTPDSCVVQVTLNPPTVVAMKDTTININDSITVTAVGTDNGTIMKYIWAKNGIAFTDTTTAGALRVAWPDSGRKYVLVKVIDDDGLVSLKADTCVVTVKLNPPMVLAMNDTSVNINDSITITAVGSDSNGTVVKYIWAKNGTTYADSTTTGSLRVAYPDSGRKVIRVRAIDDDGILSQPDSCIVRVTLDPPVVTAMRDTNTYINDTLAIMASASDNGTVKMYVWAKDGISYLDTTISGMLKVVYPNSGLKVVRVKAIDDDGIASFPDSCVVNVKLGAPVATGMSDTTVAINDSFFIHADGEDTNGTIVKYLWSLDGTNFTDSTDSGRIQTAFIITGVKTVRVMVRDDDGNLSIADNINVTVNLYPPTVVAMTDSIVTINDSFYVHAAGSDLNGSVVKYAWALDGINFSDSSSDGKIKTSFNCEGYFSVRVKCIDDDKVESNIDTIQISVYSPMAAGGDHSLIISADGTLWACGRNDYGQLGDGTTTDRSTPVPVMSGVQGISAGEEYSLILKTDGTLWACGHNNYGQLGDGTTKDRTTPVQVMSEVQCISAGYDHSLIIKSDGTLWACGYNNIGQLGDGSTTNRSTPVQVMGDVKSISAGSNHSLILRTNGTLWACGANNLGELGDGTTTDHPTPVQVMSDVKSISAGDFLYSLILKSDGTLWGCGYNSYGQLGDGTTSNQIIPVQVMNNVQSISTGFLHSLILKTNGTLWACGSNYYGQLGNGFITDRSPPVQVMSEVKSIAAGNGHSLILKNDGTLWACGYNFNGQLGDGTLGYRTIPEQIISEVLSISAGASYSLILKNDSILWVCGHNNDGQLGVGDTIDKFSPMSVISSVQNISGGYHSLILKSDSTLWACGNNNSGQLGDGTTTNRSTLVQVMSGVLSVEAGAYHSLILKTDSTLWVCGRNNYGQLGDGTTTNRSIPVQVMSGVKSIAAGSWHSLILKNDNTLWVCGHNSNGQLGDGGMTQRTTPVLVMSDVQSISAGGNHSLILKTDNTLWACGYNNCGQLGDGSTTNRSTPVQVMNGILNISAGYFHSLIIKTDSTLWACGDNTYGQLGDGTKCYQATPIRLSY